MFRYDPIAPYLLLVTCHKSQVTDYIPLSFQLSASQFSRIFRYDPVVFPLFSHSLLRVIRAFTHNQS
jgi:hypothetical protein